MRAASADERTRSTFGAAPGLASVMRADSIPSEGTKNNMHIARENSEVDMSDYSKSGPNPELSAEYERALKKLEEIKSFQDYRFDLPAEKLEGSDEDYDKFMCRNNVLGQFTGAVQMLIDPTHYRLWGDYQTIAKINKLNNQLIQLGNATWTHFKSEEDMEKIKANVSLIAGLCVEYVESNNPSKSAAVN
jgi:hypothetical protein